MVAIMPRLLGTCAIRATTTWMLITPTQVKKTGWAWGLQGENYGDKSTRSIRLSKPGQPFAPKEKVEWKNRFWYQVVLGISTCFLCFCSCLYFFSRQTLQLFSRGCDREGWRMNGGGWTRRRRKDKEYEEVYEEVEEECRNEPFFLLFVFLSLLRACLCV